MDALRAGILYQGRVLDLRSTGITVLIGERLVQVDTSAALVRGIAPGDLILFTVTLSKMSQSAPQAERIERIGGPLQRTAPPGESWSDGDALRWRRPGQNPARLAQLRLRHSVLRAVRAYFDEQGFVEVETPSLVTAPSPEPHFVPIPAGDGFLITSPEFQLKRLLVGGMESVYRIGPAFRGSEQGALHNPEFTLLEWYRTQAGTEALAADLHGLLVRLVPLADAFSAQQPEQPSSKSSDARRLPRLRADWVTAALPQTSVAELFQRHLRMDLRGAITADALRAAARAAGWGEMDALTGNFDAVFSRLWIEVEAHFPPAPFLVVDWPAPLASLARLKPGDPTLAERMELYAAGLELANGFAELTDAAQQRARFEANLVERAALGLPPLPLDDAFLRALEDGMPPSAGMALGIDRLVMLVAGVAEIRDVLSFSSTEL